jgi:hypothetical protein
MNSRSHRVGGGWGVGMVEKGKKESGKLCDYVLVFTATSRQAAMSR